MLNRFVAELRDVNIQKTVCASVVTSSGSVKSWLTRSVRISPTAKRYSISSRDSTNEHSRRFSRHQYDPACRPPLPSGFPQLPGQCGNAFVSAYRKYKDRLNFDIHIEYIASPRLTDKTLIITDPMLATGSSMELAYEALRTKGHPAHIHVASIIASKQAIEYLQRKMPDTSRLYGSRLSMTN